MKDLRRLTLTLSFGNVKGKLIDLLRLILPGFSSECVGLYGRVSSLIETKQIKS